MLNRIFLMFVLALIASSCCLYQVTEKPEVGVNEVRVNHESSPLLSDIDRSVLLCAWIEEQGIIDEFDNLTEKEEEEIQNKAREFLDNFTNLSEQQKQVYTSNGLKFLVGQFDASDSIETARCLSELLARYYYLKEDTKKSMFWAFKGADNGSSFCMLLLSDAYRLGKGVVQDLEEGIKWMYLGAATGDETCEQWVKENGANGLLSERMAPIFKEARKRAKDWMEERKELFFTSN
ncbi:MAG: tetratricopeptide repeat protein [Parachlamydiaceae bacterium]